MAKIIMTIQVNKAAPLFYIQLGCFGLDISLAIRCFAFFSVLYSNLLNKTKNFLCIYVHTFVPNYIFVNKMTIIWVIR